jgi:hypothetical protein
MAVVEMDFTYLLSFRAQQDGGEATILRSRETCFIAGAGTKQVPRLRSIIRKRLTALRSE